MTAYFCKVGGRMASLVGLVAYRACIEQGGDTSAAMALFTAVPMAPVELSTCSMAGDTFSRKSTAPSAARSGSLRAFLATQRNPETGEETFTSIILSLETIVVLPAVGRAILIHRGVIPVVNDDADDVVHLMLAAEDPAHRKSLDHYREVLRKRLDKEKGALFSMKEEALMPPLAEGWLAKPDYGDMAEMARLEHRGLEKAERGRKAKLADAKESLLAAGFEVPDDFEGPDAPAIPDPYDVDAIAKVVEEMEAKAAEMEAQAKEDEARMKEEARASFAGSGRDDRGGGRVLPRIELRGLNSR